MKKKVNAKKLVKRLNRYDKGKTDLGYQQGLNWSSSLSTQGPLADVNSDLSTLKANNLTEGISQGTLALTSFYNNGGKELVSNLFKKKATEEVAKGVTNVVGQTAGTAGAEAGAGAAAEGAAEGAGSSAAGALGSAVSVAGALYSGYNYIDSLIGYKNGITANDLQSYSSTETNTVNGSTYRLIGGYDGKAVDDLNHQMNVGSGIKTIGSAAGIGASIGSLFTPLGTAIGAGVGGLIGGITHLIGKDKRNERLATEKKNYASAVSGFNQLEYSEGMTRALRNQYRSSATGKPTYPDGYGKESYVSKNEVVGNVNEGWAGVVHKGSKEGADDVKMNLKTSDYVLGRLVDPMTGLRFMDEGRGPAIRILKGMGSIEDHAMLNEFKNRQNMVLASTNKNKKYALGKADYIMDFLPAVAGMTTAALQYNNANKALTYTADSYVENDSASKALDVMRNRRYDTYNPIRELEDTQRKALYEYNYASMPAGLRMAMKSQLFNDMAKQKASIHAYGDQMNNQYAGEYAQMLNQVGQDRATRMQQSRATKNDMLARANATRNAAKNTALAGGVQSFYDAMKNLHNSYWQDKNIGLWYEKQKLIKNKGKGE